MSNDSILTTWEENLMSAETIYFGGLPWNLFFMEKPEFADKKGNVLNCCWESEFEEVSLTDEEIACHMNPIFCVYSCLTIDGEEYYLGCEDYITLKYEDIVKYFYSKMDILKKWVFIEVLKAKDKTIANEIYISPLETITSFLKIDSQDKTNKYHSSLLKDCIEHLKEYIPEDELPEEEKPYKEFFSFFVKEQILKKVNDKVYVLRYYNLQEFKYIVDEALFRGCIDYKPKDSELQPLIYSNKKKSYSIKTWGKAKAKKLRKEPIFMRG